MPARHRQLVICTLLLAHFVNVSAQTSTAPPTPEPSDTSLQSALDHGAAAFQAARYDAAVQHFKTAVSLDPTSAKAHLYLGTAYAYQVVPNLDTPENRATANHALQALKPIPETDPDFLPALREIAAVYRNTAQIDLAREAQLHILQLEPSDPEAHYTLGVLDWQQAYSNARAVLAQNGLTDDGNGNPTLPRSACLTLRGENGPLVHDGLDHLTRAIELRPNYDDAMQYLQLTLRRDADLACGDDATRAEDLAKADLWTSKAMAARKQNESKAAALRHPR